jgi:endoglucanase
MQERRRAVFVLHPLSFVAAMTIPTPSLPSAATAATSTPNIYNDFAPNQAVILPVAIGGFALLVIAAIAFLTLRKKRKAVAWTFLGVGVIALLAAAYMQSTASRVSLTFSTQAMLASEWTSYKTAFVLPISSSTERTIDPSQNNITTSEGESYTMLRAAWVDDQATFDANWAWTQQNLERPDDVFSWLYGQEASGTYGILTAQGGENSASDADSDIALALLFAYGRWQEPQYLASAKQVIQGIWNEDVVSADGKPYLAADNLERSSSSTVAAIDPSYFSPYAYRIFATIDPSHPWTDLLDDSYAVMTASIDDALGSSASADLPPDWIGINKTTGALTPLAAPNADTNYGFDAMRLPWRLALDWEWNKDPRDQQILSTMSFLQNQWDANHALGAIYGHDGSAVGDYEAPAIYGGDLGYFIVNDPSDAQAIYNDKLLILFDPGTDNWKVPLGYYDANWAWFGMALYDNALPNLASSIPSTTAVNGGSTITH